MPAVTRKGDIGSGHGTFPPRASTGGSSDVFAEGVGVHRQGDSWAVHCSTVKPHPCHGGSLASGSSTVFADGLALGRVGDPVSCGSTVVGGAATVFAGG